MSNENSPPPSPSARRASFSPGQKLTELFGRSPTASSGNANGTSPYPGSIATAAAQMQGRRLSISTLGLSGSPSQLSPFANPTGRRESTSSAGSQSIDESAVEDGDAGPNNIPATPFARRISFGARALRDVKSGTGNLNGRASTTSASSPSAKGRASGEGFNWSEQLRSRAERSSSITSPPPSGIAGPGPSRGHERASSVAVMEPPVKGIPKTQKAPDAFQERILKGDFYMD